MVPAWTETYGEALISLFFFFTIQRFYIIECIIWTIKNFLNRNCYCSLCRGEWEQFIIPNIITLNSILILFSHLRLVFSSCLSPQNFGPIMCMHYLQFPNPDYTNLIHCISTTYSHQPSVTASLVLLSVFIKILCSLNTREEVPLPHRIILSVLSTPVLI